MHCVINTIIRKIWNVLEYQLPRWANFVSSFFFTWYTGLLFSLNRIKKLLKTSEKLWRRNLCPLQHFYSYLEHGEEDSMSALDSFSLASFTSSRPLVDGGSVVPCTSLDMVEYPSSRLPLSGVSSPNTRSHFVDSSTTQRF